MDISTTSVSATGQKVVQPAIDGASTPPFDCFYVYPTVSNEKSDNADLVVQPVERATAADQMSHFSSVCRVFAPMYRQRTARTLSAGLGGDPHADRVAYASVLAGWKDYLAHDNDGRPIIFVGHSQGAAMLIRLLHSQVDDNATLRAKVVSAILLGGNVTVKTGQNTGGTFEHLPLCTSSGQAGCVIAYSTFPSTPPTDSLFGRPGQGVSLQSDQTATKGLQVACVNPAALGGGSATLHPVFPSVGQHVQPISTTWVEYPDLYTAACQTAGGATWLQVTASTSAGDTRQRISESQGPQWGFHSDDVNLAIGDLVSDVAAQEATYTAGHH